MKLLTKTGCMVLLCILSFSSSFAYSQQSTDINEQGSWIDNSIFNTLPSDVNNFDNPTYRLEVPRFGKVTVSLESSTNDSLLYLLDSDFNIISKDDDSGTDTNALINKSLEPGTYFLVAARQKGEFINGAFNNIGDFNLNLRSDEFDQGDLTLVRSVVKEINFSGNSNFGSLGPNLNDIGNFITTLDVEATSDISIGVFTAGREIVFLVNESFEIIQEVEQTTNDGTEDPVIHARLNAGVYYIVVGIPTNSNSGGATVSTRISSTTSDSVQLTRFSKPGIVTIIANATLNLGQNSVEQYGVGATGTLTLSIDSSDGQNDDCPNFDVDPAYSYRTSTNSQERKDFTVYSRCSYDLVYELESDSYDPSLDNSNQGRGRNSRSGEFYVLVDNLGEVTITRSGEVGRDNNVSPPTITIEEGISNDRGRVEFNVLQQVQGNTDQIIDNSSVKFSFNNVGNDALFDTFSASYKTIGDIEGVYIDNSLPLVKTQYNFEVIYTVEGVEYKAADSFTFRDGTTTKEYSVPQTIIINQAPEVFTSELTTQVNTPSPVAFNASDPNGDNLTYNIVSQPANGQVTNSSGGTTGNDADWVFTPATNFAGTTSFTFSANDGFVDSTNTATVNVTVTPNVAPAATAQSQLSVNEDSSLNITLSGVDPDGDNNSLTFSISSQPQNGSLAGSGNSYVFTPSADFNGSTFFTFISNDGIDNSTAARIDITVNPVNDAPTINGQPATSVADGKNYQFTPTVTDVDTGDTFTFSITNKPSWASFSAATGALTGTPARSDVGTTSNIVISVTDSTDTASLAAFSIEVLIDSIGPDVTAPAIVTLAATNASGISINDATVISFLAQVSAVDAVDGVMTTISNDISGTNLPLGSTVVQFTATDSSGNTGTASTTVTVTDQTPPVIAEVTMVTFEATSIQTAVTLTAPDVTDNLDAALTATASNSGPFALGDTTITWQVADGAGNTSSRNQVIRIEDTTAPKFEDIGRIELDAMGRLTDISTLFNINALDLVDGEIAIVIVGQTIFESGVHQVEVTATDNSGRSATKTLEIAIKPIIQLSQGVTVFAGTTATIDVVLTGEAVTYPVLVDYTVTDGDIVLVQEQLEITSGQSATIEFTVDANALAGTQRELTMTGAQNAVLKDATTSLVSIVAVNVAPIATINVVQQGITTGIVALDGGDITLTAQVSDVGPTTGYAYNWEETTLGNLGSDASVTLSAELLSAGPVFITLTVEELDTADLFSVIASKDVMVVDTLTLTSEVDSDGDGMSDAMEGAGDSDDDGIADYLDTDTSANVLPINDRTSVIIAPVGVKLSLGSAAIAAGNGQATGVEIESTQLLDLFGAQLATDDEFEAVGDIINFKATGLAEVGGAVTVIVQLASDVSVPNEAVYRKFSEANGWSTFTADGNNQIASAMIDVNGNCPVFNTDQYQPGLIQGTQCIALTIQDGGIYDADGKANGSVEDPGVLSVLTVNNAPVLNLTATASALEQSAVSVTATATDPEADALSYTWLQTSGTTVSIDDVTAETLVFIAPDVMANEDLSFSLTVSDGVNEVLGSVLITVEFVNSVPTVSASVSASSALEQTSVTFTASADDSDGQALSYSWSQLSGPDLNITNTASASFAVTLPAVSTNSNAVLRVTVSDGIDAVSVDVTVTIQNQVTPPTNNTPDSGGGGSLAYMTLLLLSIWMSRMLMLRGYVKRSQ